MRARSLSLILASMVFGSLFHSPSAYGAPPAASAPAANAGAQGVPFDRLQKQIDKLRQRIEALEAASPAGQSCPSGQFVTGFNSAGTVLCASASGGTPTPPPSAQVPAAVLSALQQALLGAAAQNVPILVSPIIVSGLTVYPRTYSLTLGAITFNQPNSISLAVQIPIPTLSITSDATLSYLGTTQSGSVTISATNSAATVVLSIVETSDSTWRLGAVRQVYIVVGATEVTGTNPNIVSMIQSAFPILDVLEYRLQESVADTFNGVLPNLPNF